MMQRKRPFSPHIEKLTWHYSKFWKKEMAGSDVATSAISLWTGRTLLAFSRMPPPVARIASAIFKNSSRSNDSIKASWEAALSAMLSKLLIWV